VDTNAILASAAAAVRQLAGTQGRGAIFVTEGGDRLELMYVSVNDVERLLRRWHFTGEILHNAMRELHRVVNGYDPTTQFVVVIVDKKTLNPYICPLSGPFNPTPTA
jgi:hypothetical protein